MIAWRAWPLVMMIGATAASAAELPLRPGTFVLAGTSCHAPPLAAMFTFDGHQFSYPHATHCRSTVRSHVGKTYRVTETCSALGDGSPTAPSTIETRYTIQSASHVRVGRGRADTGSAYRWCSAVAPARSPSRG